MKPRFDLIMKELEKRSFFGMKPVKHTKRIVMEQCTAVDLEDVREVLEP